MTWTLRGFASAVIAVISMPLTFSSAGLFVLPLIVIGGFLGYQVIAHAEGEKEARGTAWFGLIGNGACLVLFLFAGIRYLIS